MALMLTKYSSLFPWLKVDIWKFVPSGNLTLICWIFLFSCRLIGGTNRIGVQMVNVPFSHSKSLRPSGRDLWAVLMAHCQSNISRRSHLNGLFGKTCRISCSQMAGNFVEGEILNPCTWLLPEFAWQGRGTGFCCARQVLQQTQCSRRDRDSSVLGVFSRLLARKMVELDILWRGKEQRFKSRMKLWAYF